MRRRDREIQDEAMILGILEEATVCRLAFCDGDRSYIVPLNFGIEGRRLYFHCASEGKKLDLMERNPFVAFEVDVGEGLVPGADGCSCSWAFRSVIGQGRLRRVEASDEKRRGLNALLRHYGVGSLPLAEQAVDRVTVLCLEIEAMTGKASASPDRSF
jgi:nitroimidazol reductase NimA-like FMN-containing flavoprotein (pyridoxamine 5'-phosphate oxidase superfamily)